MERQRVIIVGGRDYNIPKELRERFEIVRHYEQKTSRIDQLPAADYVFVITDFVNHNVVDAVKRQSSIPVVWLGRGWSHMKLELQRRSILPPDSAPEAAEPAREEEKAQSTTTGLSEDELWRLYKAKIIEAVKGALIPGELVSEADLLDLLSDIAPQGDMRMLLPRLHMGGVIMEVKEGHWSLMIGSDGFESGLASGQPTQRPTTRTVRVNREPPPDRALKMHGLKLGPYASLAALIREMLKYEEFHIDGKPMSIAGCRNIIKRAVELKIVDDTHAQIYVDHKDNVVLKRIAPPDPEPEIAPPSQAPPSPAFALEQMYDQMQVENAQNRITKEKAEELWREVVERVKVQKKMVGTIIENGRIEWLADSAILCCLVPSEYSVYMRQLDSTETWGLVSSIARECFGAGIVIRFVLDNAATKGRA